MGTGLRVSYHGHFQDACQEGNFNLTNQNNNNNINNNNNKSIEIFSVRCYFYSKNILEGLLFNYSLWEIFRQHHPFCFSCQNLTVY